MSTGCCASSYYRCASNIINTVPRRSRQTTGRNATPMSLMSSDLLYTRPQWIFPLLLKTERVLESRSNRTKASWMQVPRKSTVMIFDAHPSNVNRSGDEVGKYSKNSAREIPESLGSSTAGLRGLLYRWVFLE
jgi:hypothetical protein